MPVTLLKVETREPYEGHLIRVSGFPLPDAELQPLDRFLERFCAAAANRWKVSSEVFIQLEQLYGPAARPTFSSHGREWMPETGLGVWVDRDPPKKWTLEEVQLLAPGDKLRAIMFQVFRVSNPQPARNAARSTMLRHGSILEILTTESAYLAKASPIFKDGIVDRSFTCFPFYVGLMEGKTIQNATMEQMHRWFQGMTMYIRQSAEDKGILIVSARPLEALFTELGGRAEDGAWTFA